jgi:hypothetical protein
MGPGGVHLSADGAAASLVLEAEVRLTGGCALGGSGAVLMGVEYHSPPAS